MLIYPEIGHMVMDECPEKLIEDMISNYSIRPVAGS